MMQRFLCCGDRAKTALDACCDDINGSSVGGPILTVSGIGNFDNSVLFATIADNAERKHLFSIAGNITARSLIVLPGSFTIIIKGLHCVKYIL
jgi:hypothetical protein